MVKSSIIDPLLDRDCILLDGTCDCKRSDPYMDDGGRVLCRGEIICKKYGKEENKEQV